MSQPWLYGSDAEYDLYQHAMRQRGGMAPRRFDEYYRCYPIAMLPGPDRPDSVVHGGKIFLPPSALEKLTRMHIAYPMVFELNNGAAEKMTHAGVLEFVAEEGKIYLPNWLMQTLLVEAGDLLQIKSTDLPPGKFIKLRPQSPAFLDISDPKAVLENTFQHFSCLTLGDIFSFSYNDAVYEIEVLEARPETAAKGIMTLETDLEVDFAEPVGYVAPQAKKDSKMPQPGTLRPQTQGTMAQAINYDALKPADTNGDAAGTAKRQNHFAAAGQRLGRRSNNKTSGTATPAESLPVIPAHTGPGPAPLRLPPGKLFFGYEYKPPPAKKGDKGESTAGEKPRFQGLGQTVRGKKVEGDGGPAAAAAATTEGKEEQAKAAEQRPGGRTLRDAKAAKS